MRVEQLGLDEVARHDRQPLRLDRGDVAAVQAGRFDELAGDDPTPRLLRQIDAGVAVELDAADPPVERAIVAAAAGEQAPERGTIGGGYDAHHNTVLFNGYSTMPWARAALSLGIRSRTVRSSMIVLTATHSSSLSEEIVGR